jgi:amphiphysin
MQLEQDFEIATNEFENINEAMKQDLPRFMTLATRFIDPLFHSYYYMQYARFHPTLFSLPMTFSNEGSISST